MCVYATGALHSRDFQRFLRLGNISWIKRRPEVRLWLQEAPPNLKHLPILGESLCLSVLSYPHILLCSFLFSSFLFVSLIFSWRGLWKRSSPGEGREGRREKKCLSFIYATSRETGDRLSVLPSCKNTQPKQSHHLFSGGIEEWVVGHFWVSPGAVVFGDAALSLDASCVSEVLLVYRVSMSDLRFTREIGSCCSQQNWTEWRKSLRLPAQQPTSPWSLQSTVSPEQFLEQMCSYELQVSCFYHFLFKEFSSPKPADIPEIQLTSFHCSPPLWQEWGLKFPFYTGGNILSFIKLSQCRTRPSVCEIGKEISAKDHGWAECFLYPDLPQCVSDTTSCSGCIFSIIYLHYVYCLSPALPVSMATPHINRLSLLPV